MKHSWYKNQNIFGCGIIIHWSLLKKEFILPNDLNYYYITYNQDDIEFIFIYIKETLFEYTTIDIPNIDDNYYYNINIKFIKNYSKQITNYYKTLLSKAYQDITNDNLDQSIIGFHRITATDKYFHRSKHNKKITKDSIKDDNNNKYYNKDCKITFQEYPICFNNEYNEHNNITNINVMDFIFIMVMINLIVILIIANLTTLIKLMDI